MRAVNLLTYDSSLSVSAPRLRMPKNALPIGAGLVGAIACGFVAMSFTGARADVAALTDDLDGIRSQVQALVAQQPKGDPQVVAERRKRESALATALGYRVAWESLLGDVGYVLPPEVLLTTLHAETPTSPVPAAPGAAPVDPSAPAASTFTITGIAPSQKSVAQTLRRLALVPGISDVKLESSVTTGKTLTFTIAANVRAKEGTTP